MNIPIVTGCITRPTILLLTNPEEQDILRIAELVAREFGISPSLMYSRQRTARVTWVRQVAMALTYMHTDCSQNEIGEWWHRDHGTVLHAYRTVRNRMETDAKVRERVERITRRLQA